MDGEVEVEVINPLPANVSGEGHYCHSDESIEISLSGLYSNTSYSLMLDGTVLETKAGTEDPLVFTVSNAGNYTIKAENSDCSVESTEGIENFKRRIFSTRNYYPSRKYVFMRKRSHPGSFIFGCSRRSIFKLPMAGRAWYKRKLF
ncbi:MAG: hypothetical protein HC831_15085 [Chloroflexia bacterium]|nr:hypothetical protein [Chloroflexia bacterium]